MTERIVIALTAAWVTAVLTADWSPAVVLNEPAPEVHVVLADGGCACYLGEP